MTAISYTVYRLNHPPISGNTTEIQIADKNNPIVLQTGHAPIFALLKEGMIKVRLEDQSLQEYSYKEGFFRLERNTCRIHLLNA